MLKVLKWIGIVIGSLIGLLVLALVVFYTKSRMEFNRTYEVQVPEVSIPADAAAVERGQHLATVMCFECHGDDMGGIPAWLDIGPLGVADTPNLTPGQGGLGGELSDEDLVRVLAARRQARWQVGLRDALRVFPAYERPGSRRPDRIHPESASCGSGDRRQPFLPWQRHVRCRYVWRSAGCIQY